MDVCMGELGEETSRIWQVGVKEIELVSEEPKAWPPSDEDDGLRADYSRARDNNELRCDACMHARMRVQARACMHACMQHVCKCVQQLMQRSCVRKAALLSLLTRIRVSEGLPRRCSCIRRVRNNR